MVPDRVKTTRIRFELGRDTHVCIPGIIQRSSYNSTMFDVFDMDSSRIGYVREVDIQIKENEFGNLDPDVVITACGNG